MSFRMRQTSVVNHSSHENADSGFLAVMLWGIGNVEQEKTLFFTNAARMPGTSVYHKVKDLISAFVSVDPAGRHEKKRALRSVFICIWQVSEVN